MTMAKVFSLFALLMSKLILYSFSCNQSKYWKSIDTLVFFFFFLFILGYAEGKSFDIRLFL